MWIVKYIWIIKLVIDEFKVIITNYFLQKKLGFKFIIEYNVYRVPQWKFNLYMILISIIKFCNELKIKNEEWRIAVKTPP